MQSRRDFLIRATTTLLLVPIAARCTTSSQNGPPTGPNNSGCDGVDSTSSVVDYHDHTVCVLTTDLTNPPQTGARYTTSSNGGHTHTVTLTQAQLASIENGDDVTITTSSNVDPQNNVAHTHEFMITKA
jgi:hypothetical protein